MRIQSNTETKVLVILTLKRHADGIWTRRLVQAWNDTTLPGGCDNIQVNALEIGIVNRVSDAAPPASPRPVVPFWERRICWGFPLSTAQHSMRCVPTSGVNTFCFNKQNYGHLEPWPTGIAMNRRQSYIVLPKNRSMLVMVS
jgi:hypothetical protein